MPFLVFVNTLPKVAIAPLFLIWLGYGIFPNMLIGALIGFFPVVINTAVGLTQIDNDMLDLGRVFNAPKWKMFAKIRVPNAYPYILSALKITATAAVVGAIVGEFVASQKGLGYVIITTQSSMNTPVAFAALVWISILGLRSSVSSCCLRSCWRRGPKTSTKNEEEKGAIMKAHIVTGAGRACWRQPAAHAAQEKFLFALNWFAVGDHAAYWVALEKGYYKASGLDVTLENSKGSGDSIAKVDTGRADAGLADTAVVIAAVSRGAKIKTVGMVFDKTPLNIFSRKNKPIRKPKDLEGATLGRPSGRQPAPGVARLRQAQRHRRRQGDVGQHRAGRQDRGRRRKARRRGRRLLTGLPNYEKAMGQGNVVMMQWGDFGFDMYSMSIIASEKTMKERPKAC